MMAQLSPGFQALVRSCDFEYVLRVKLLWLRTAAQDAILLWCLFSTTLFKTSCGSTVVPSC